MSADLTFGILLGTLAYSLLLMLDIPLTAEKIPYERTTKKIMNDYGFLGGPMLIMTAVELVLGLVMSVLKAGARMVEITLRTSYNTVYSYFSSV